MVVRGENRRCEVSVRAREGRRVDVRVSDRGDSVRVKARGNLALFGGGARVEEDCSRVREAEGANPSDGAHLLACQEGLSAGPDVRDGVSYRRRWKRAEKSLCERVLRQPREGRRERVQRLGEPNRTRSVCTCHGVTSVTWAHAPLHTNHPGSLS